MTRRTRRARSVAAALLLCGSCGLEPERNLAAGPPPAPAPAVAGPAWDAAQAAEREMLVTLRQDQGLDIPAVSQALAREYGLTLVAEWPLGALGVHCLVLRAGTAADAAALRARLSRDPRVEQVQPMNSFAVLQAGGGDPLADLQHGLDEANVRRAQALATGRGVRIGLIDTAVDAAHPDLRGRMAGVQDFTGAMAARGEPRPAPEGHGTALAGILVAERGNGQGIVGVAPDALLLGLRACWQQAGSTDRGRCNSFTLARAVHFALVNRLDVLNLSLQGAEDPLLARLLTRAIADGVTVVAAYDARRPGHFPASLPGVVAAAERGAIGAAAPAGLLQAPGVDILSTAPGGTYAFTSGSSVAAAHVAGAAALLLERAPRIGPAQITALLRSSTGSGAVMLDACRAVAMLLMQQSAQPEPAAVCGAAGQAALAPR